MTPENVLKVVNSILNRKRAVRDYLKEEGDEELCLKYKGEVSALFELVCVMEDEEWFKRELEEAERKERAKR